MTRQAAQLSQQILMPAVHTVEKAYRGSKSNVRCLVALLSRHALLSYRDNIVRIIKYIHLGCKVTKKIRFANFFR